MRKQGHRLHLPKQSFQILKMLLERPGELITREQLHATLWPSDTFVDFEHGLNAAINRLRETLGDDAESPRYIETLPRRGYRFIGPMIQAEPTPVQITTPVSRESQSPAALAPTLPKRSALWGSDPDFRDLVKRRTDLVVPSDTSRAPYGADRTPPRGTTAHRRSCHISERPFLLMAGW